jgi:hypothetical protein
MEIQSFDDLLRAARAQPAPQRLLMVFAGAELPADATPAQRERFALGEGGALVPLMCVDKTPEELGSFSALVQEARQFELPQQPWRLVFTAALEGTPGRAPSSQDAEQPLRRMVEAVKTGALAPYLPFDRQGRPVRLG